jgi:predicted nucleic acid-binding protein
MVVLDTSVWIEFLRAREPFYSQVKLLLESGEVLGVSWVFGELLQGARGASDSKTLLGFWDAIPKPELALCEKAWIQAGLWSQRGRWHAKGVGLIDAAILCVAREFSCKVWTLDSKLQSILRFKGLLHGVGR